MNNGRAVPAGLRHNEVTPMAPISDAPPTVDVLRWPVLGSFLRWRHARTALQLVLLSFAGVDHLSSAALGTLITVNGLVKNKGGQFRLSDIDPQIYEVFVITKLVRIFEIHPTAAEALKSFK